ncbi:hypothetical protein RFI_17927, partial [Reticulomyxa filosa]
MKNIIHTFIVNYIKFWSADISIKTLFKPNANIENDGANIPDEDVHFAPALKHHQTESLMELYREHEKRVSLFDMLKKKEERGGEEKRERKKIQMLVVVASLAATNWGRTQLHKRCRLHKFQHYSSSPIHWINFVIGRLVMVRNHLQMILNNDMWDDEKGDVNDKTSKHKLRALKQKKRQLNNHVCAAKQPCIGIVIGND